MRKDNFRNVMKKIVVVIEINLMIRRPSGNGGRDQLYCSSYSKDSPDTGVHNMVHMVAERDTDSVAPTPTPHHPHHSQHHHLSLHELRALQVSKSH